MKTLIASLLILFSVQAFAGNNSKTTGDETKKLETKVQDVINQAQIIGNMQSDEQVVVIFSVNPDNTLTVTKVESKDSKLTNMIDQKLNGLKLSFDNSLAGKTFGLIISTMQSK